ncbi:type II secretion system protein J [Candidatus Omnitrophota bacterium]
MKIKSISKRGLTLTEVLIVTALLGVVVGAVTCVDITARNMLNQAERITKVNNEASLAMEHIVRNLHLAIGCAGCVDPLVDGTERGVRILNGGRDLEIRQDDGDARYDPAVDPFNMRYRFAFASHEIEVNDGLGPWESLAENIRDGVIFSSANHDTPWIDVRITARFDPTQPESLENPEVTLRSRVLLTSSSGAP